MTEQNFVNETQGVIPANGAIYEIFGLSFDRNK